MIHFFEISVFRDIGLSQHFRGIKVSELSMISGNHKKKMIRDDIEICEDLSSRNRNLRDIVIFGKLQTSNYQKFRQIIYSYNFK